jgi:hypothetical protein
MQHHLSDTKGDTQQAPQALNVHRDEEDKKEHNECQRGCLVLVYHKYVR